MAQPRRKPKKTTVSKPAAQRGRERHEGSEYRPGEEMDAPPGAPEVSCGIGELSPPRRYTIILGQAL